ncbi:hypothetical protein V2J09_001868 [Rumex salicifolius]
MLRLVSKKQDISPFLGRFRSFTSSGGNALNGSSSSAVMSFGDGSQGALGLPSSIVGIQGDVYEPTKLPGLPPDIVSVSAGQYHSLAVTSHGELWAWGRNEEGQLGRGLLTSRDLWNEPHRVAEIDKVRVRAAFASGVISSAIGDDGSLWIWGRSKRGQLGLGEGITEAIVPSKVNALSGQEVSKVSFGWGHALALTTDGKLYGWGYSADGRLGNLGTSLSPLDSVQHMARKADESPSDLLDLASKIVQESIDKEDNMPIIWEPRLIEELKSIEVMDVACGLDHSLLLCSDNTVLSGGSNTYNQLGRVTEDIGFGRVQMAYNPISIASGLGHSMAICRASSSDQARNVISWGWNGNSQLGRVGPPDVPSQVDSLEGEEVVSVSGGRVHSLAVTAKGELWAWGCGKNGRIGLGSSFDEPEPFLVEMEGVKVVQAVAGFDHTLVLVSES